METRTMTFTNKDFRRPKFVLFDWDGTLVNTNGVYRGAFVEVLQEMGIEQWDKAAEEKYRYHSRRESLPLIFGDKWEEVDRQYVKKIQEKNTQLVPFENALVLVRYLYDQGVTMSIISNKFGVHLRQEVESLNWTRYFDKIVGSTDAARDKPWPDPVQLVLEGSTFKQGDSVWFVGDSLVDMQCARDTGCFPVLFGTETGAHMQMSSMQISSYMHVHDHKELISKFQEVA